MIKLQDLLENYKECPPATQDVRVEYTEQRFHH